MKYQKQQQSTFPMMDKFKSQKFQVFKYLTITSKHLKIFSKFSVGTTASCNILNQLKAGLSVFEKEKNFSEPIYKIISPSLKPEML